MENKEEELPATQTPNDLISFETKDVIAPWGRLYPCMEGLQPYDLVGCTFRFGRLSDCDVSLQKNTEFPETLALHISKVHFEISKIDDSPVFIKDLSKNGTLVNGNKIGRNKTSILQNDDTIAFYLEKYRIYMFKTLKAETEDVYLHDMLKKTYVTSGILGQGACGEVRLAFHKATCKKYAIKKITKAKYINENKGLMNYPTKIYNEIRILQTIEHPFIIDVHEVFETENEVFIILDYMPGGDLTNQILSINTLTESNIKWMFYQIVYGVQHLHKHGITHRDLKPQNVLLQTDNSTSIVKISDFGLSKILEEKSMMETVCGTLCYTAPEVLDRRVISYNNLIDVWSMGVILFYMITKTLPFVANDQRKLCILIITGAIKWNKDDWVNVSKEAQDLVKQMLVVNPSKRITIEKILEHPWFSEDLQMQFRFHRLLENYQTSSGSTASYCCPAKRPRLDCQTFSQHA